jgi:hypothetical protein
MGHKPCSVRHAEEKGSIIYGGYIRQFEVDYKGLLALWTAEEIIDQKKTFVFQPHRFQAWLH